MTIKRKFKVNLEAFDRYGLHPINEDGYSEDDLSDPNVCPYGLQGCMGIKDSEAKDRCLNVYPETCEIFKTLIKNNVEEFPAPILDPEYPEIVKFQTRSLNQDNERTSRLSSRDSKLIDLSADHLVNEGVELRTITYMSQAFRKPHTGRQEEYEIQTQD